MVIRRISRRNMSHSTMPAAFIWSGGKKPHAKKIKKALYSYYGYQESIRQAKRNG
jgi:hypothetical protein